MTTNKDVEKVQVNPKDVYERLVRRQDVPVNWDAFPDIKKGTFRYMGTLASTDKSIPPNLTESDISFGIIEAGPGPQSQLHDHEIEEIFIPLDGLWEVSWGPNGEEKVTIGPLDLISVPPNILRAFANVGASTARLMVIQSSATPNAGAGLFEDPTRLTNVTDKNN
ncbi:hypothetical protein ACE1TI_00305 [Alteribacillus sp. JSM 102045]|uniref:hypothetical protein n=1 Tax=Alteribacillus sp. JSM 102045 TaxID=1562101 RepID=UPI0035C14DE9